MRALLLVVAVAVGAATATAAADPLDGYRGAMSLEYEAGYVHAFERDAARAAPDGLALAGARMRAQLGKSWLCYRVGLDLQAGATAPGGFAYDVDLYLVGAGVLLGRWSRFGVVAGIGAAGATPTLDDVVQFPVEASLEVGLGGNLRMLARGRVAWLAAAPKREDGAPSVDAVDALDGMVAIRFGRRNREWGYPTGNGYYLGVAYREADGARMLGAVIGHSIDAGSK